MGSLLLPPAINAASADPETGFDAQRAYGYLVKICQIGTRVAGSQGMSAQQKLLTEHFEKLGGEVRFQSFDAPHPLTGAPVRMSNLIVSWHPKSKERILLCCHYDTRPYPDQDRTNPQGLFLGANDGASGVALFMEMAHQMPKLKPTLGVDLALFDGEELIYGRSGTYFLGSEHFAKQYRDKPPTHRYRYGILVDMIGDKNLRIGQEKNSMKYAQELTESVWAAAKAVGIREFVPRVEYEVQDDHIPLNEIAKIPTCDLIDFDYPWWHTTKDTPQQCSGQSLAKVARVLSHWLQNVPAAPEK